MTVEGYFAVEDEAREEYLGSLDADALLHLGIELYQAGHYWNAHEAWEEVWLQAPRELRAFYQGLIQITAAFVHLTRNEYPGTVRLLDEGIAKLEAHPDGTRGIALAAFVAGARAVRERVHALGEKRLPELDRALIPRIEPAAGRAR